jgi:hypothetical protein
MVGVRAAGVVGLSGRSVAGSGVFVFVAVASKLDAPLAPSPHTRLTA